MKTTNELQLISVDQLIPYVNNARIHSPEQINKIRASLREFGFVNPLIIDRKNNVIADMEDLRLQRLKDTQRCPVYLSMK